MSVSESILPLSRWEICHTREPAQACAHLSDLFRPHRVITHGAVQSIDFKHNRAELGNFSMNAVRYGEEVTINAKDNSDNYLIVFTLRGASQVRQRRSSFETNPETVCVLNPTLPLEDRLSADCDMLIVQLAGKSVRQLLADELGMSLKKPLEFLPVSVPLRGTVASYFRMVTAVCNDINQDNTGLQTHFVVKQVEHMLASLLLTELPHTYSEILHTDPELAVPGFIQIIDNYIDAHLSESITIKDLADAAQMSVRHLQKAFGHYKGVSPMTYLRNRRLDHARKLLLSTEGNTETITATALSSGFTHMSRFANYYRERYGELPSETCKSRFFIH